jgi:transcriptional regulator with XRE-family HTH domain
MESLVKEVGRRLKQIRKAAGITQEKLAEKAGLSVEYISRLERGIA